MNDFIDEEYPFGRPEQASDRAERPKTYPNGFNKPPAEGWFHIPRGFLSSAAWREMPSSGRDVVLCVASVYVETKNIKNGELAVSYDDFCAYGIRRSRISEGIAYAVELGFLRVHRRGRTPARRGFASHFELTWQDRLDNEGRVVARTNEWKSFTMAKAKAAVAQVKREIAERQKQPTREAA